MNSFWQQRTASEKRMIILCLLVVVVGVPFMLFSPAAGGKALLSAADARQKYKTVLQERDDLIKQVDKMQPAIEKMAYKEPPEVLIPQVIRTLQGFAKDSGVHLREIKPLRAKKIAALTKETMSVRFTSSFSKAIPFLYRIDDPDGKLVVEKFNVNAADPKSRQVDVDVQVALFTQGGEPAAPAGTTGNNATTTTASTTGS